MACDVTDDDIVRIFVTYDMGWSKRGNGKQYDSQNGYAAIIGYFSQKVLGIVTLNVACKACDCNVPLSDHDCRKNFAGTAKAMEAEGAKRLVAENELLQKYKVEVGIFGGDNDSASIYAIRQNISHLIVKVDDGNHSKKGVVNLLYKVDKTEDPQKELSKVGKEYLRRCFAYCIEQNKDNVVNLAKGIRNIPYHAFNIHDNCGDFCKFKGDPENYEHSNIPGGFQSPELFKKLTGMFETLSQNAQRFATLASSQVNESLNNSIAHKVPKNICFSLSESADTRVHCAALQKNLGLSYVEDVLKQLDIDPGSFLEAHNTSCSQRMQTKSVLSKTPGFKLHRRQQTIKKSSKRKQKESTEVYTYRSNMTFLDNSGPEFKEKNGFVPFPAANISQNLTDNGDRAIVYFCLKTSAFSHKDEILQIALKCNEANLNLYVTPSRPISPKASGEHGLTCVAGELFCHGKPVVSLPKRIVVGKIIEFLSGLRNRCILVGHMPKAGDMTRLILLFQNLGLFDEFSNHVAGFTDTTILCETTFPDRKKNPAQLQLSTLVSDLLKIPFESHDAFSSASALEKLSIKFFSNESIFASQCCLTDAVQDFKKSVNSKQNVKSFLPLVNDLSIYTIKKIAATGISYDTLKEKFDSEGEFKALKFLQKSVVLKEKQLNSIKDHFVK